MGSDRLRELDILFEKYLENKCTEAEKNQLLDFISKSDNERSFKEILLSHLNEFQEGHNGNQDIDFERIYNELMSEIIRRETEEPEKQSLWQKINVRRLVIQVSSIAAVSIIAFFIGTFSGRHHNVVTARQKIAASVVEIKAPLGARSEVRLNDGTEVMLNAGSKLRYSSDYNIANRDLELEGEAYFKVAKNMDLPLVVNAGNINIKATGTEFNVKAYTDDGIIETTLVDGEVVISHRGNKDNDQVLVLKPNQKAIYAEQSDQLTLEKIREIEPQAVKTAKISTENLLVSAKTDVEQVTAWTKNKLIIRSENLESLCIKLQRKYNVTFVFRDEKIKRHRFSGVLLDETLQQVLDVIKLVAPVDYSIDKKTVFLFSKDENEVQNTTDLNNIKTN